MGSQKDIVVFPGDGIGPEIVEEALRVLSHASSLVGVKLRYHFCDIGDGAKARWGVAIPDEALELFRKHRVALKGPVGESVAEFVTKLRRDFDLYINLRPVKSCPNISPPALRGDIDMVIIRENVEDVYIAREYEVAPGAWRLEGIFTKRECERIARYAFELARGRRRYLTVAHKANVMRRTHGLFVETFKEVSKEYPDVKLESLYADALSAYIVRKPQDFDVIACPNLIGDIISDLAAEVAGGLGLAGSANINPETGMGLFEPIHGSAPDIAGRGVADPISQIRSASLMLSFLSKDPGDGFSRAAALMEAGVTNYLCRSAREALPIHLGGSAGTREVAESIIKEITKLREQI
jgi:3-isopropylmalate dehydrogenase